MNLMRKREGNNGMKSGIVLENRRKFFFPACQQANIPQPNNKGPYSI